MLMRGKGVIENGSQEEKRWGSIDNGFWIGRIAQSGERRESGRLDFPAESALLCPPALWYIYKLVA
jgi:hypothetical protein